MVCGCGAWSWRVGFSWASGFGVICATVFDVGVEFPVVGLV